METNLTIQIKGEFVWTRLIQPRRYRKPEINIASPYLWSFSNHYTKGKFLEGSDGKSVFRPNVVSKQCGAAVLLKRMLTKGMIQMGNATIPTFMPFKASAVATASRISIPADENLLSKCQAR